MKKVSLLILVLTLTLSGFYSQAQYNDSLRRSAGFFISPALNNYLYSDGSHKSDARFGLSAGFRFKNELKQGFFLEGGVGITTMGGDDKPFHDTIVNYYTGDIENILTYKSSFTQINVSTPFMAGYRTTHGKVRFEGAAGIAFNLRVIQYEEEVMSATAYQYMDIDKRLRPKFGTSFSALARAGISIPITSRTTVDILPTLRYSFLYFTAEDKNIGECINTDLHKWSAGIDIGLTWKLDDLISDTEEDVAVVKNTDPAYTNLYTEDNPEEVKVVKKKSSGPKNFIYGEIMGNGMYYSHNYERTVFRKNTVSIQARGGFSILPDRFAFPIGANVALGKHHKKFEMGLGTTIENVTTQDLGYYEFKAHLVPSLAYRYEAEGHFFLRLALMSHYFFDSGEILPGFGISVGGCF